MLITLHHAYNTVPKFGGQTGKTETLYPQVVYTAVSEISLLGDLLIPQFIVTSSSDELFFIC